MLFFPSYANLNATLKSWGCQAVPGGERGYFDKRRPLDGCYFSRLGSAEARDCIFRRLRANKDILVEPRKPEQLDAVLARYAKSCAEGGAIICAVMKGKVSEGLSMSDGLCRMVIVAGLPLPPKQDPTVKAQMARLDRVFREGKGIRAEEGKEKVKRITGQEWYKAQGYVGVNQAVGRVIRHRADYGAVLFLDERFVGWDGGTWVGKVPGKSVECLQELKRFYAEMEGGEAGAKAKEVRACDERTDDDISSFPSSRRLASLVPNTARRRRETCMCRLRRPGWTRGRS